MALTIDTQPKGSFAAHVRGVTKSALPLQFPFGYLENLPTMSREERRQLQADMCRRYAVHYSALTSYAPKNEEPEPDVDEPDIPADDEQYSDNPETVPDPAEDTGTKASSEL